MSYSPPNSYLSYEQTHSCRSSAQKIQMADIGTVLGAAQTLFAALECSVIKEICSALGYKSQLEDLRSTVQTVKSVLLDAASSEELTHAARDYIEKLKAAVYDADDLFDEFRTLAERKQNLKEGKLSEKVRLFFSSENSLKVAYKMSREIKKVKKNLDGIARDHTNFGFAVDRKRIRYIREETCSYVNAPNVIGREADVEAIVEKLLDLKGAPFLSVVGIGGMGKTTLAQLVCADQRVKKGFASKVWWICVADENNNQFDKKSILCKILDLASGGKHHDLSLEEIQMQLRRELEGKKYLLVLDDLWNEDKVKWTELKDFLLLGARGSRIMVTTRSHDVAKAIGDTDKHVLKGLSDENSWSLFEMIAFEEKPYSRSNPLEVEIGKKIVKQCSNVPLAIKVVGSLLCGQSLDKWQSFERSGIGGVRKGGNQIMSILKFSYHNLEPSLKSCFTYCALFPKDYVIEKEMLIRHWMAHGYVVPFDRGQSIEEASEEHFLILLRRCFFQDVRMDKYGNVRSIKMHDLIHDVAEEISGQEILVATSETSNLDDKVRHVFEGNCKRKENLYSNVHVRSYLRDGADLAFHTSLRIAVGTLFTNGGCLRMLTLIDVGFKRLPDSIGKLLHLRYLDLSQNCQLKKLPESITKLHNLQTLNLEECESLRELPKKFSRLVNLMHLNIENCPIRYMPPSMDKLTSLCELTHFVVADESSSGDKQVGQLKDLKAVAGNLKGRILIDIHTELRGVVLDWEGSVFERAEQLREVRIEGSAVDEVLLEKLLPHPNVKEFELWDYEGVKVARWGRADYNWATILPNLVFITIADCPRLKHLPVLSKLKHLKSLTLAELDELEYIDETSCSSSCASAESDSQEEEEGAECTLFPSLESLEIQSVPKLKGWWAGMEFGDGNSKAILPNVVSITIKRCPGLKHLPVLSKLKHLKSLTLAELDELEYIDETSCSSSCASAESDSQEEEEGAECTLFPSLESLEIQSVPKLKGWWAGMEFGDGNSKAILPNVVSITIKRCPGLKHLPVLSKLKHLKSLTLAELFNLRYVEETSCSSSWASAESDSKEAAAECKFFPSLESLEIKNAPKLKGLWRGVEFGDSNSNVILPNVVSITIWGCPKLKHLPLLGKLKHLKSLNLCDLDELEFVDKTSCISSCASGISDSYEEAECRFFPSLESLRIENVPKLKGLCGGVEFGDSNSNVILFPSLEYLTINNAPQLKGWWAGVEFGDSNSNVILFPSLEYLTINNAPKLKGFNWEEGDDDGSAPWRHLHQNLRSLSLWRIENMTKMPKGMQYLTSLEDLHILFCENLEEIPDWISCLSSLQSLYLGDCKKVKSIPEALNKMRSLNRLLIADCSHEIRERCKKPNGEDWPKIKHIPHIFIR